MGVTDYRFLCPQCGRAFREGVSFSECPQCQVPLLTADPGLPADAENLPRRLDIGDLMKRVLADQRPGEEIDAALERVVDREFPNAHDSLIKLVRSALDLTQQMWGGTRLEAGQRLAENTTQLEMQPDGKPIVKSIHEEFKFQGAELLPEQQEQLKRQVEEALRTGKPLKPVQINQAAGRRGCSILMLVGVVLVAAVWAVFGS
jgi:hypothetical protein